MKTHYKINRFVTICAICVDDEYQTINPNEVTCKNCLKEMQKRGIIENESSAKK